MRHRSYGDLDEKPMPDGEAGFVGVDEREPALIAPGFVSEAVNYIFRDRVAKPRKGIVPLGWISANRPAFPWDFTPDPEHSFEHPRPIAAEVLAGYVFSDGDEREWLMLAVNPTSTGATQVWACRQGVRPRQVEMPDEFYGAGGAAGNPRLSECSFEQGVNSLVFFRGTQYPALELADVREGFIGVTQTANDVSGAGTENPSDGTEVLPQAVTGAFIQNRMVVPHDRDLLSASDYLNFTRYTPRASMRINQGSADALVRAYKYGDASLIAFKSGSVYVLHNFTGDLSGVYVEELTREFGLAARRAVAGTGRDVFFLSERGVSSIVQVLENKAKTEDKRWTDKIPKTWGRINWRYASNAAAAYDNGFLYFAVPLDDATVVNGAGTWTGVNNAILVFDTETNEWAGVWSGRNVLVRDFVKVRYQGKKRLCYVGADGLVYLMGWTFTDQVRPGTEVEAIQPIETRLVTRGMTLAPAEASAEVRRSVASMAKRFNECTVVLSTWNPEFSISARVDGANEEVSLVQAQTYDRREYWRPFNRAKFDVSNVNGDHGDPGRKDYSVDARASGGTNGETSIVPLAHGPILLGAGVNCEQHQEAPVTKRLNVQGRYVQLVIENVQGRCEVKGVAVTGRAGRRRNGVAV